MLLHCCRWAGWGRRSTRAHRHRRARVRVLVVVVGSRCLFAVQAFVLCSSLLVERAAFFPIAPRCQHLLAQLAGAGARPSRGRSPIGSPHPGIRTAFGTYGTRVRGRPRAVGVLRRPWIRRQAPRAACSPVGGLAGRLRRSSAPSLVASQRRELSRREAAARRQTDGLSRGKGHVVLCLCRRTCGPPRAAGFDGWADAPTTKQACALPREK